MSITSTPSAKDKINPRLDHLLSKIENPALRSELDREINKLKMNKKFGLVFEEHMPEHVRLPEISIAIGSKVVKKAGRGDDVFVVQSMKDKTTMITHEIDGHFEEVDPADLIVIKKFEEPIYPSLIPIDRVVRAKEKPFHTIINAENFNALELLLYSNEKQVDVIYIDPPYNTGARDWKYNNNYIDSNDAYRHSKWLSMMKRRLLISKRLLHKNGVLIVTIDENELPTLNLLLWELFPDFDATPVTIRHNPRGIQGDNFSYCNEVAFFLTRKKLKIVLPRKLSKDEVEPSPLRKWGNDS
jgi:adenine-specific DNA-methyltransferase